MENERNQCRKCGGNAIPSKAFRNYHHVDKSYLRGEVEFEIRLINCIKCSSCGHSWIPENSTTELTPEWWNNLSEDRRLDETNRIRINGPVSLYSVKLTGKEIEEIWRKECNRIEDKVFKPNQKQFKEFNPELFKSYIDKFSDEDKIQALKIFFFGL
jgi:hypothetical protein